MKVLFLEVDMQRNWAVASIGPSFIASYIRQRGHQANLLRIQPDWSLSQAVAAIRQENPNLLAFSLASSQWLRARDLMIEVRAVFDVPTIAGGLHPTFSPEQVLASRGFDYVCLGEGEEAMADLLSALEKGNPTDSIPNIWSKGGERPALRPPLESLDAIPFMARDFLDERHGVVHIVTQRGCPFPCSYCAARNYHDLYKDAEYGRRRSHQNVMTELVEIRSSDALNYVIFLDDTFTLDKTWVMEFCKIYGREIGVGFSIHARAETVGPEMIERLALAGCKHIVFGVESGSYRIRRDVLKRPVTNRRMKDAFRWAREAEILVTANYMIGLPEETPDDIEQTLALNEELQPNDFGYFVFYPYPGTHLFQVCREKGYLPENYLELPANNRQSILNLPDLSEEDIAHYYDRFTAVRQKNYMNQYGSLIGDAHKSQIADHMEESAKLG